jgi:hypothetical protein
MLPAANPTSPSEPTFFSATPQINGTILFEWGRSIVQPARTEFQIIRSVDSANAAVGTVVWRGLAGPVPLVMPTSRHAYYVRAIANSTFSPYQPNTFGLIAAARGEAESPKYSHLIRDWDFSLSTEPGTYWISSATNVMSLSPTGGIVGGKMVIKSQGPNDIFAAPLDPLHQNRSTVYRTSLRLRCCSAGPGVSSLSGSFAFQVAGWTGVGTPVTASNVSTTSSQILIGLSDLIPVMETWVDYNFTNSYHTSIANPSSYPYLVARMQTNIGSSAVSQFEIDLWKITLD